LRIAARQNLLLGYTLMTEALPLSAALVAEAHEVVAALPLFEGLCHSMCPELLALGHPAPMLFISGMCQPSLVRGYRELSEVAYVGSREIEKGVKA
jgi:hypothetical protein